MRRVFSILASLLLGVPAGFSQTEEQFSEDLRESSEEHMREELGVNPITSPSIAGLLNDLEIFRPIPIKLIEATDHSASFGNRLQTALHFGSLVADGFMFTLAERPQDIQTSARNSFVNPRRLESVGG